jgi:hypothetical protein
MALVGAANGEPSGLQICRMAVSAAANGEPRGFKYVIFIYYLSKWRRKCVAILRFFPSVKKWYSSTAMTSCFARAAFSDVISLKLMAPRN